MADVFISYVHEDRDLAERLATALQMHGWSVWWDRTLLPGQTFQDVIEAELSTANAVVVLWSAKSIYSDWVRDEAQQAQDRKVLIPCLIETATPPLGFRQAHCADLKGWAGDLADERFIALRRGIERLSRPGAQPEPVWMRNVDYARRWSEVPEGATLWARAFVYQNRDAVAISLGVQCSEKRWLVGWNSSELVGHEQRLCLVGYPFFKVSVSLSTFGKSDILVMLRLVAPDGAQHGEPFHIRSNMVPTTEHTNIAIKILRKV
jgi:hypothetical protein